MIQMLTGEPPWKNRVENVVQLHMLLMRWEGPPPYTIHARYLLLIIFLSLMSQITKFLPFIATSRRAMTNRR